jgi:thiol-disulfide isomerase/thioredoxin
MRRAYARFVLIIPLVLLGCDSARQPSPDNAVTVVVGADDSRATPQPGDHVRLSIVDYQGIMERIASHRGKVVVMDAWATSCPPCMKEFHNLVELHKQYGPEKLAAISLSFDYEGIGTPEEQTEPVLKFLQTQGATFDNLMSNEESDVLYRKFDLAAVPAVFVYDQQGKLVKRFDNQQAKTKEETFTYEHVKALVAGLIDKPPGEPAGDAPAKHSDAAEPAAGSTPAPSAADEPPAAPAPQ